jgi:hypothetical protein
MALGDLGPVGARLGHAARADLEELDVGGHHHDARAGGQLQKSVGQIRLRAGAERAEEHEEKRDTQHAEIMA